MLLVVGHSVYDAEQVCGYWSLHVCFYACSEYHYILRTGTPWGLSAAPLRCLLALGADTVVTVLSRHRDRVAAFARR